MSDLDALFAAAARPDGQQVEMAEMVVTSTGPLRVAYPAQPSITYYCAVVGATPSVGARVLVLRGGAAAIYCLGPIS